MEKDLIEVYREGNSWSSETVSIDPVEQIAIVESCECTFWGYHDESEYETTRYTITVEEALRKVYPDEKAIALILRHARQDYSATLAELKKKHGG